MVKFWTTTLLGLTLFAGCWLLADEPAREEAKSPASLELLKQIKDRAKVLTLITEKPHEVDAWMLGLCSIPDTEKIAAENPHSKHWVNVYTTANAVDVLKSGKGAYPVGTLIVKEKLRVSPTYLTPERTAPKEGALRELFTVMLKRESGYDAQHGDWEYLVVNADATQVLARGKLDSCIDCHSNYKDNDYVTRLYVKDAR